MKVAELIEILKTCDPEAHVATHANNHTYYHRDPPDYYPYDPLRVCELSIGYVGRQEHQVVIGNVSKRNVNKPNWYVTKEFDGGKRLPDEWSLAYDEG